MTPPELASLVTETTLYVSNMNPDPRHRLMIVLLDAAEVEAVKALLEPEVLARVDLIYRGGDLKVDVQAAMVPLKRPLG